MIRAILISLFFVPALSWASADHSDSPSCIPANNLYYPVGMNFSGVTEQEFNDVLDRVAKYYEPIVNSQGANLDIVRSWSSATINARAWRTGSTWHIEMYGGLARHELVTADGFALVACHELGHHLGGHPRMGWAANEGQSDYWGSLKCLRRIWQEDDNLAIIENQKIEPSAAQKCDSQFKDASRNAICKRGAMAGLSLAKLLAKLGGTKTPDFDSPDTSVVTKTNNAHPAAQCRLDTYFHGSLCTAMYSKDTSDKDADEGVCSRKFGEEIGVRPLCWYKPSSSVQNKIQLTQNN